MMTERVSVRRGFTLVELTVVMIVGSAMLGAALMMSWNARVGSQSAVSIGNLKLLARGQFAFAAENDQNIAGPNWSGARYEVRYLRASGEVFDFTDELLGDTSSTMPTTSWDWISPVVGAELGFSANRAERTADIFELLADPRATRFVDQLYLPDGADDGADFERVLSERGFRQISYLAYAPMLGLGDDVSFDFDESLGVVLPPGVSAGEIPADTIPALLNDGSYRPIGSFNAASIPDDYRPRLDVIAKPGMKALVGEGTRFVAGGNLLDIDVPLNIRFGNFASSSPIAEFSTAYGRSGTGRPDNLDLSFRYPNRSFHLARFDGSAARETAAEAWGAVEWFFPAGSVFDGDAATAEALARYELGDVIP